MNTTTSSQTAIIFKEYISETYLYEQTDFALTTDFPLFEKNIIDSMGIFRLIAFIGERFNITIPHEDMTLENFGTIDAMAALVDRHLQGVQSAQT